MTPAYIGLGSNLDNPLAQLRGAATALAGLPGTHLQALSPIYRSAPVGPGEQDDYLNAVARIACVLSAADLLAALHGIEQAHRRERRERWGPRTLDLDLLLFGDARSDDPALLLPHPRMAERDFVLLPLRDVWDDNCLLPDGAELGTLVRRCPRGRLEKTEYQFGEIPRH